VKEIPISGIWGFQVESTLNISSDMFSNNKIFRFDKSIVREYAGWEVFWVNAGLTLFGSFIGIGFLRKVKPL